MTEQLANRPDDPRWRGTDGTPIDEDHRGLVYDIGTLVDRRAVFGLFGGVAVTTLLAACSGRPDVRPDERFVEFVHVIRLVRRRDDLGRPH